MKLFTVHDKASGTFIAPFPMKTERDAREGFRVVTNDKESPYNKFPADYTLIELGSFDERTGEITVHPDKVILVNAAALIETKEN